MHHPLETTQNQDPTLAELQVGLATTQAEREAVFRFRYEVYIREMGKPLAAADHARGRLTDGSDERALLLVANGSNGTVMGTLRLHLGTMPAAAAERVAANQLEVGIERVALVGKTMVDRGQRGSRVFLALARTALALALDAGMRFGMLHCRPELVPLYARLGYRRHATPFVDQEVGEQVPMVLDLHQVPDTLAGRSAGNAA